MHANVVVIYSSQLPAVTGSHCADVICPDIIALQFFPSIHFQIITCIYYLLNNYLFIPQVNTVIIDQNIWSLFIIMIT